MRAVWFIGKFELLLNYTKYPIYSPKSRTPQEPQNVNCKWLKKPNMTIYPEVSQKEKIGDYPALVNSGGGFVWDEVLEYRVWCHPENGAPDIENGNDYYYVFDNYDDALRYSEQNDGTEKPLALILQKEYIDEPEPEIYRHVKEERITEWPVEFLNRPKRNDNTIPNFLSPNAPINRLSILKGIE